jgi:hypothetical protein
VLRRLAVVVVALLAGCAAQERWESPAWDQRDVSAVATSARPGQVVVRAIVLEVVAEARRAHDGPLGATTLARLAGRDVRFVDARSAVTDLDRGVTLELSELARVEVVDGPGYVGPFG